MKIKLAKDGKRLTSYIRKNVGPSCSTWHQAATMYLPSTSYTGCYSGTTSANLSWQASQLQDSTIADRAHQIGMVDHTRSAHAAQQGPSTTINSGAGTSTAGSFECMQDAFHQPANNHATNNVELVSEMAIIPTMPTSTPLNTSTSNTQVDETAADTEVNDETDDESQGYEDGGQSEIMVPQPPYVGQRFDSFVEAKEFYQTYAKFHGFAVNTEYHRKIKKTNEYSRGEMRFQEEIKCASMYTAFQVDEHTFKVCSILGMSDSEPEDPDKGRNYFVKASISKGEYYCQCCKFEWDGIVCCHVLKGMYMNVVTRKPRHFIRRRWTWDADDALAPQTSNAVLAVHDERPESTMEAVRHVVLTKNCVELIDEACKSDKIARVAEKHRKALKRELDEIKKREAEEALHRFPLTSSVPSSMGPSSENSEVGSGTASTQTQVRNPPRSITKGHPKEIGYKSGLEIQTKHKKTKKGAGNP
ncbi:hypothetical protein VPH35_110443 [Triticum aestivum]